MQRLKILGPPGTGKTEFLLRLLEKELQSTRPDKIAFLTFTRAAREEALRRVKLPGADLPYLRTIHSLCYRELGIIQGQIVKARDLKEFGKLIGARLSGNLLDPWLAEEVGLNWETPTKGDQLLQLNHLGRHNEVKLRQALLDASTDLDYAYSKWFTQAYHDWKEAEHLVDYTDLLTDYLANGSPLPIEVLFVDEAQDLSKLQWDVVKKLGANADRWYLAGDDDQAIYTWAGAAAELFINEKAEETTVLDQSYRLTKQVFDKATEVITQVNLRLTKQFRPREVEGSVRPLGYLDEKYLDEETLILFRNHQRGHKLASQLEQTGVPFAGPGSVLGDKSVVAALRGWYRLCVKDKIQPHEAKAVKEMCGPEFIRENLPKKFTEPVSSEMLLEREPRMEEWPAVMSNLPNLKYLERTASINGFTSLLNPKVTLMSVHQSKGREAHTVILDTEMARKTYDGFMKNPDDEHRVWYVGVTRAKERLFHLVPLDPKYYPL